MRELLAYAARQGIEVHVAHLPHPYRGYYDAERRRIIYDFTLTPIERREVLAHELGHAHFGHDCEDDPLSERQADIFAAQLLIRAADYERAERVRIDPQYIADELGVTVEMLEVYQRNCLVRLRGITYAHTRMGAGQWAGRIVNA